MKALPLFAGLLLATSSLVADEPMFSGASRAGHDMIEALLRSIPTVIKTHDHCSKVDNIRAEDVPSDFVRPDWADASQMFELWTAKGCGTEFPLLVSWTDNFGVRQAMVAKYPGAGNRWLLTIVGGDRERQ